MRPTGPIVCLAFAPLMLFGCSMGASKHRSVGSVEAPIADAASLTRIAVHNVAGTVEIRTADQAGASVRVEVLLSENRPQTDFRADFATHVEMTRSSDGLIVKNRHGNSSDHNDWQLRFVISVPPGVSLTIDQVAGTVTVQLPRAGDITIQNIAGDTDVQVATIEGKASMSSQAGKVLLSVSDRGPTNGCDLNCTAGSIVLRLPKDIDGDFDAGTITGNVDISSRYGLTAKRSMTGATATGRVGKGGSAFRTHTVSGSVELR